MSMNRRRVLTMVVLLLAVLGWPRYVGAGEREGTTVRWDIVNFTTFSPPTFQAGGHASARANDGSGIMLTGSGTFEVGENHDVSGGGRWMTLSSSGTETGRGSYRVTGLVRFDLAPGTIVGTPIVDNIGDKAAAHSGLAVLTIRYSDGSHGVLIVSCDLPVGTPPAIFEGVTASKSYVDYWNREAPIANVDGNRTVFHFINDDEDRGDRR